MRQPRIALATYAAAPDLASDDRLLLAALRESGAHAEPTVWSDTAVEWASFDVVVIRSCWDYHRKSDEFAAWLATLQLEGTHVWNPVPLVRWNADKRYLLDLARRGVPTIPTIVIPKGEGAGVSAVASAEGWSRFVIKPAISASGYETYAFDDPHHPSTIEAVTRVASLGDALIQPFAPEVPRDGELSLVFLDGEFSHAARKRAARDEFRVQVEHGGTVEPTLASREVIEQGARAIAVLDEVPLYARVDGILRDGALLLMELELIEPNLFLALGDRAAERMANAILRDHRRVHAD